MHAQLCMHAAAQLSCPANLIATLWFVTSQHRERHFLALVKFIDE